MKKKSDILQILEHIEDLSKVYKKTSTQVSANAVAISIATESSSLAVKLYRMKQRWERYLPYKEVDDVKFLYWSTKIAKIEEDLFENDYSEDDNGNNSKSGWFVPSARYYIDMYRLYHKYNPDGTEVVDEEDYIDYNLDHYSESMMSVEDDIRRDCWACQQDDVVFDLFTQYRYKSLKELGITHIDESLNDTYKELFRTLKEGDEITTICQSSLTYLSNLLNEIYLFNRSSLSDESFERLAKRFILWYGSDVEFYARESLEKMRIGTPPSKLLQKAQEEYEREVMQWKENKFAGELVDVLNTDTGEISFVELGRFIYNQRLKVVMDRKELIASKEDIHSIIWSCYSILSWHKEIQNNMPKELDLVPVIKNELLFLNEFLVEEWTNEDFGRFLDFIFNSHIVKSQLNMIAPKRDGLTYNHKLVSQIIGYIANLDSTEHPKILNATNNKINNASDHKFSNNDLRNWRKIDDNIKNLIYEAYSMIKSKKRKTTSQ